MHGAGSAQAQRILIFREEALDKKISLAKRVTGIPTSNRRKLKQTSK
jgi:4-hydroxybutyryl-CoA dehydratase/vinylacetyl-CoA-Delta-isomerase